MSVPEMLLRGDREPPPPSAPEDPSTSAAYEGSLEELRNQLVEYDAGLRDPAGPRRMRSRVRRNSPGGLDLVSIFLLTCGVVLAAAGAGLSLVPFGQGIWAGVGGTGFLLLAAGVLRCEDGPGVPTAIGRDGSPHSLLEWAVVTERPGWLLGLLDLLEPGVDETRSARVTLHRVRAEAALELPLIGGGHLVIASRLAPIRRKEGGPGERVRDHLRVTLHGSVPSPLVFPEATSVPGFALAIQDHGKEVRALGAGGELSLGDLEARIAHVGLIRSALHRFARVQATRKAPEAEAPEEPIAA